jgi:TRAP-type C4-dicarboxylate transport system, periplasmic component
MNPKKKWALLWAVILLCTFVGCADSAGSDEPVLIKIGHTDSATRSTHLWSVWLGEYLEERAPGRFIVEVYPDGELGDTSDLIEGLKQNKVTMVFDLSAVVAAAAGPEAACIDLPYLYPSYEAWLVGTFENGGLELFRDSLKEYGYYCIDMYYNGMRQVISRTGHYRSTADVKGQKIRIARNLLNIELWQAMGAYPAPLAWGQVIDALEKGQIDALDHSLGVFNDFSLHETAPYITLTNHASSPFPIITSLEWIESLSPELRAILEEGVHEMARQQREEERAKENEYLERFRREGAVVVELTDDEVAAFMQALQPVYDTWRGIAGNEIVDAWLATIPKN